MSDINVTICDAPSVKTVSCWEFMWREQEQSGKCVHRTTVIGTAEQYPTKELAREAVHGLRMQINDARNRQPEQAIFVDDLIGHYVIRKPKRAAQRKAPRQFISVGSYLVVTAGFKCASGGCVLVTTGG